MMKLGDGELNQVSGGFKETNSALPTNGASIRCPDCGASSASSFAKDALLDTGMNSVEYSCQCGCKFVCYGGYVIKKAAWIAKCGEMGYSYPFA